AEANARAGPHRPVEDSSPRPSGSPTPPGRGGSDFDVASSNAHEPESIRQRSSAAARRAHGSE
ncbi:hypothetical protein HK102_012477, partial [Quaeritorhiza haematococci]